MTGLRFIRLHFGMSIDELAKKMGLSRTTVLHWEYGAHIPDMRLGVLSNIFGLSSNYFGRLTDETIPEIKEKIADVSTEYRMLIKKRKLMGITSHSNSPKSILEELIELRDSINM